MRLRSGDIITVGTGASPLRPGDPVEVEGVGALSNPVIER